MNTIKSLGGYLILLAIVVMVGIVAIHRHVSNPEPKKIETPHHPKAPVKPQPKKTDAKPAPKPHHKHLQRICDPATGWCWTEWR